jgi:zinc protease
MRALAARAVAALALVALSAATPVSAKTDPLEIPYSVFKLDNGLTVVVHEDRKAPIVAVNVWYHVGSKDERPGKTGFAHLFEHLMFNGSENWNDEYFVPFQKVGATEMNGTTNFDRTNYFANVPSSALDLALWMESDRMGHLMGAVDQAKLDEQRGVVQNEKRQGENQPYGRVFQTILANIYPTGHPYSWPTIGSMEDLNAASLGDVQEWFKTYYGPNNAVIVLAGDIDVATAKAKVTRYFGDIPAGPPLTRRSSWIAQRSEPKRAVLQDRVPQVRIYKVWNVPGRTTPEMDRLIPITALLAGDRNSRLYKRLVYTDQTATDVGGFPLQGEIAGAVVLFATVRPGGDPAKVEAALNEEIAAFLADGPTKSELERVKTQCRSDLVFDFL